MIIEMRSPCYDPRFPVRSISQCDSPACHYSVSASLIGRLRPLSRITLRTRRRISLCLNTDSINAKEALLNNKISSFSRTRCRWNAKDSIIHKDVSFVILIHYAVPVFLQSVLRFQSWVQSSFGRKHSTFGFHHIFTCCSFATV